MSYQYVLSIGLRLHYNLLLSFDDALPYECMILEFGIVFSYFTWKSEEKEVNAQETKKAAKFCRRRHLHLSQVVFDLTSTKIQFWIWSLNRGFLLGAIWSLHWIKKNTLSIDESLKYDAFIIYLAFIKQIRWWKPMMAKFCIYNIDSSHYINNSILSFRFVFTPGFWLSPWRDEKENSAISFKAMFWKHCLLYLKTFFNAPTYSSALN